MKRIIRGVVTGWCGYSRDFSQCWCCIVKQNSGPVGGAGNSGGGCSFVSGQQGSFAVSFYFFFALLLLFRMRKVIQE